AVLRLAVRSKGAGDNRQGGSDLSGYRQPGHGDHDARALRRTYPPFSEKSSADPAMAQGLRPGRDDCRLCGSAGAGLLRSCPRLFGFLIFRVGDGSERFARLPDAEAAGSGGCKRGGSAACALPRNARAPLPPAAAGAASECRRIRHGHPARRPAKTAARMSSTIACIVADWGTTNLRIWAMAADGRTIDRRLSDRGLLAVERGRFAETLEAACGDWLAGRR